MSNFIINQDLGAPISEQFGDIYFSAQDGLAETRHVFLDGNALPAGWMGKKSFTILETGFGTGLNFLASAKLFRNTAPAGQTLHFVSVEKYPLAGIQIKNYLAHWRGEFPDLLDALVEHYPLPLPGFHRLDFESDITLTLIFDDANEALPRLYTKADCWFLDGFKPASNPDMWSDKIFTHMANLSHAGTSFATFTAAGFVKRGLENVGFTVNKVRGFGRKREMLVGKYTGSRA
jgi:tRNA 5-methylaminomethyl-2-thiouridine biosynthesis bifunctional protein